MGNVIDFPNTSVLRQMEDVLKRMAEDITAKANIKRFRNPGCMPISTFAQGLAFLYAQHSPDSLGEAEEIVTALLADYIHAVENLK